MSAYSSRRQPALQNLLRRVVRFFHARSACTTHNYTGGRGENICVLHDDLGRKNRTIRYYLLQVFCGVTGFASDFLSFGVVEHIRFFHGDLLLCSSVRSVEQDLRSTVRRVAEWNHSCLHTCESVTTQPPSHTANAYRKGVQKNHRFGL